MKSFSEFKSQKPAEVVKDKIQEILSELTIEANEDLTSSKVEIVGLEEAELAIKEHIETVKAEVVKDTIYQLSEALKQGKPWQLIVEQLLEE